MLSKNIARFAKLKTEWILRLASKDDAIRKYAPALARYASDVSVDQEGRPYLAPGTYWRVNTIGHDDAVAKINAYQGDKYTLKIWATKDEENFVVAAEDATADEFHRQIVGKSSEDAIRRDILKNKKENKINISI